MSSVVLMDQTLACSHVNLLHSDLVCNLSLGAIAFLGSSLLNLLIAVFIADFWILF